MFKNHFVFADLSTYNLETAKAFYSSIFEWEYQTEDGQYCLATIQGNEVSGLYETPQKFKDMNMPSFWMSYIHVENVAKTVSKAKALGGIIELVDKDNAIGKIALIRDPLGAGFTIYEGNQLNTRSENTANGFIWNELFVSDLAKVQPFYEGIFDWKISGIEDHRYAILDSNEKTIGHINVVSNDIKGKYEYWGVFFSVENVATIKRRVLDNGGALLYEDENIAALADTFGAFFHVVPLTKSKTVPDNNLSKKPFRWKAFLGLGLITVHIFTEWAWIWSIFFALWVFMDLKSGHTHLLEPIAKKQNPVLYWLIVIMWAFLGIYSSIYEFI